MASQALSYIGPYRLLNSVHTSGPTKIWQAFHDGKQEMFGVKAVVKEPRKHRSQVALLRREFDVGQKVGHARIIRFFEYGLERGIPYVVMEWFSAPNMKQRIRQGNDQIAYLVPTIVEQAAEGLAYLHHQKWVHRDIKPDNFLVADDGTVKLIDLGLAVRVRRGLGRLFALRSKVQGTRSYMSPEQIRGEVVDERSDVYSFGCTMYELLSGTPPFTGVSANELLNKHLKTSPPTLEAIDANITPQFAKLVRRCMAKDPNARPESLNEFLREVRMHRVFKSVPPPPQQAPAK